MNRQVDFLRVYLTLVVLLVLQACTASNPITRAETVEQKAYATYGTFVIFEEQAAKLVSSGQLGRSTIVKIGDADRRAKPIADSLLDATLKFTEIREEYEATGTGEERFIAATKELNGWVEQALPLINNLVAAVRGAQE
jgi:hypothetical protein